VAEPGTGTAQVMRSYLINGGFLGALSENPPDDLFARADNQAFSYVVYPTSKKFFTPVDPKRISRTRRSVTIFHSVGIAPAPS
jgi:hypothetical protein